MAGSDHDGDGSTRTVEIHVSQYLADPGGAARQAETVGRVVVKDAAGTTRLVLNSNRVTEVLLDE
jgi:hypothetical protein